MTCVREHGAEQDGAPAGCDQNGPRVRVTKMVRWPATESLRYMSDWIVVAGQMEDLLAEVEQAERGDDARDPEHRGDAEHARHIPGLGLVRRSARGHRRSTGWRRR